MSEDRYKWYVVRKEILETHIVRASSLEGAREKVRRGFSKAQEKDTGQIRVIEFKLPEEPGVMPYENEYFDEAEDMHYEDFADPGGDSALRAASKDNPRNLPCPSCGEPNRLTPKDVALHYQCDSCANEAEGGGY